MTSGESMWNTAKARTSTGALAIGMALPGTGRVDQGPDAQGNVAFTTPRGVV